MKRTLSVISNVIIEKCEINAELHELVEPEEPVQDNFVATPMTATDAEEMRMNIFFPKPKKSENSEK